jgi:hypothetical protein
MSIHHSALLTAADSSSNPGNDTPDSSSSSRSTSYLLSLDSEGWVGLWDESTCCCVAFQRAAPFPPGAEPYLLPLVSLIKMTTSEYT